MEQKEFLVFLVLNGIYKKITQLPESPLELVESCDSNPLYDNGLTQRVAYYPYVDPFSVDPPENATKVEVHLEDEPF